MKKIKRASKKTLILGLAAAVILAGAGGLYYQHHYDQQSRQTASDDSGGEVKLAPATKEEKQAAEQNKEVIAAREQQLQNQPANTDQKAVKPIITYAGQYGEQIEAGAYVPGIFEEGGACTATFTNGSSKVTKSVKAVRGANSVDCPVMSAGGSEFTPKGSWSILVSYSSAAAAGTSDARTIEVK